MSRFGPAALTLGAIVSLAAIQPANCEDLAACCIPPSWQCFMMTEEECNEHGGTWFEAEHCDPAP
jgi:hypothetical protein